jgi:DNA-binding transcriptional MerR regulator
MRIGELCERSGRTARTLHFYEELGLLVPASRTKGGFRLYDESALLRIQWIGRLQDLGFSLPEIKEFLASLHGRPDAPAMMGELFRFYTAKLSETRAQLARLQALEGELQQSLEYLGTCLGCAPRTGKHSCPSCRTADHADREAPVLVAAVRTPPAHTEPTP